MNGDHPVGLKLQSTILHVRSRRIMSHIPCQILDPVIK